MKYFYYFIIFIIIICFTYNWVNCIFASLPCWKILFVSFIFKNELKNCYALLSFLFIYFQILQIILFHFYFYLFLVSNFNFSHCTLSNLCLV